MSRIIDELKRTDHKRYLGGLDFFKYIGPGLLVTVGFIDPGNCASNFAAGSEATRFREVIISCAASSKPSSILTSMTPPLPIHGWTLIPTTAFQFMHSIPCTSTCVSWAS